MEAVVKSSSDNSALKSNRFEQWPSLYESPTEAYLSATVCDKDATFEAQSEACISVSLSPESIRDQIKSFTMLVKSRGIVRQVMSVDVDAASDWPKEVLVPITPQMTPNFVVFVSAVVPAKGANEVIPASVTVPVARNEKMFSNSVGLQSTAVICCICLNFT